MNDAVSLLTMTWQLTLCVYACIRVKKIGLSISEVVLGSISDFNSVPFFVID